MLTATAPAAHPETRRRRREVSDALLAPGVAVYVVVLGVIAAVAGHHFFYVGDNPESFIPLWHHFGSELREGHWWTMEPSGWMGGNYVGEAAYAQWNPFLLLAYVVMSFFTDLALGATVIMISMMALLGAGAFLLMRAYGGSRSVSFPLAGAVPVTGFTLYYEAAGWPAGLAAFVGVTWFWLAVRKLTEHRWPPFVTFVFGYLAVTTGNPYALLGVVIVLGAVFGELLLARRTRDAVDLVVTGALVGVTALLVFLPLLGVQPVTVRQELAGVVNDTFMVPGLSDLAGASTPSFLPTITNWGGALIESLPSTYLAWFFLPLLPWVQWRAAWMVLRTRASVLILGSLFFIMVLGPSNLWLFRWPIRLIEYLYLAALVALAIALSRGFATTAPRRRIAASAVVVAGGAYLAAAATPTGIRMHAASFALVAVLLLVTAFAAKRAGMIGAMSVIAVGTILVVGLQTAVYPRGTPTVVVPSVLPQMEEEANDYEGAVLQLGEQRFATADDINSAGILFGNLPAAMDHESINRYSGISFRAFSEALCMDYKGSTCPDAYQRLWEPVDDTQGDLVDALRVGTLVIHRASLPDVVAAGPPAGWREVESDDTRVAWIRSEQLEDDGRVSGTSAGVRADSVSSSPTSETVKVEASQPGVVTFARLAWPGYEARVDGSPVVPTASSEGLLQVPVPEGESSLELGYAAPGLVAGGVASGVAAVMAAAYSVLWFFVRRRSRQFSEASAASHRA